METRMGYSNFAIRFEFVRIINLKMTQLYQIKFIKKSGSLNLHKIIESIAGSNFDGSHWQVTVEKAIDAIEFGEWNFYIWDGEKNSNVVVGITANGEKYLKSELDNDNECALTHLPILTN